MRALAELKPNAIFVGSSAGILAARRVTQSIPLVMITLEDPVKLGLMKSIAQPGTNVTGTLLAAGEALAGKKLALLRDVVPSATHIAAFINPDDPTDIPNARELPAAARALGLQLQIIEVRATAELDAALARAASDGTEALFVSQTPMFLSNAGKIVAMAERLRLPGMYGWRPFVEAGGLLSYGPNLPDVYRHSAALIDKILKGESPANLPIETPTRFELVVNLKAAKAIGLTISDKFLLLADEVIE